MRATLIHAAAVFGSVLLLAGCGSAAPPRGSTAQSYSNDHTTTAGGFGLGPEDVNTNGGAFGPEAVGH